jgi:hypothetical protein
MSTHPGFYRAVVVDNQDPDGAGRVRLRIPQLLGTNNTGWAYPMSYSGVPPEVNDLVWASFEGGDPAFPIYLVFGTVDVAKFASVTGKLPIANGGTNAATAAEARTNLGAAASGANTDITSLTNPTINTALNLNTGAAIVFEGSSADAFETTLTVTNPTVDRTVTIPNATTTLVGTDTTDNLTNKSISGATNTLTNIPLTTAVTGSLPVANGGTAGTTQATARSGIGAAKDGANSDITSLTGLTTALTIGQGGTGRTSFSNNAVAITSGAGALTTGITGTAQQIVKFNSSNEPVAGSVTLANSAAVSTPIQAGTNSVTISPAAASASKAVTFATPFDVGVSPNVVVTATSSFYNCNVSARDKDGFTYGVRHIDGTAASTTVTVYWIAMATS